ncbi:hypothetical protein ACFPRL_03515 [Pseudoclavibacter helvolus]
MKDSRSVVPDRKAPSAASTFGTSSSTIASASSLVGSAGVVVTEVGLGVGGGVVSCGVHPITPTAAPKPSRTRIRAPIAPLPFFVERLNLSPDCMGVKVAVPENPRRSYPQVHASRHRGRVLTSIEG